METGGVLASETAIRLAAFGSVLAAMAVWELLAPRRVPGLPRRRRWPANLGLVVLDTALARIAFPVGAVGVAIAAEQHGLGVLPMLGLSGAALALASFVLLDLAIYLQHVTFHALPVLWRLHRVHHADPDFDVTTGVRFHPLEILLSMGIKAAVVAGLGAPPVAVLAFEVTLNATSMFNHGNVRLAPAMDRWLRRVLVTPDMHRVHHSVEEDEANSNFGFNLSWWDRLLGTYRPAPRAGHAGMRIGLRSLPGPESGTRLGALLALPFTAPVRGYAINRRTFGGRRGR